jgi:hypothetical protein
MKTTSHNTLSFTAMRIVFPLWLAMTFFSGSAAAWGTQISADGKVTCDSNGLCSSDTPLGVGPGPSTSESPINPADQGMCGVLHLAGTFNNYTVAHIVVGADHYYHFDLQYKGTPKPQVELTCVRFTEFTGLGPTPSWYPPAPITATGGARKTDMLGSFGGTPPSGSPACIWAGLAGALSTTDRTSIYAFAQYDGSFTLASAQSAPKSTIESYAFCNVTTNWTPYLNNAVVPALTNTKGLRYNVSFPPPGTVGFADNRILSNRWWCYMDGVGTAPGSGTSDAETFSFAGLAYLTSDTYDYNVGGGSTLWYNCIGLDQNNPSF